MHSPYETMHDWKCNWGMHMMWIWLPIIIVLVWVVFKLLENSKQNNRQRDSAIDILKRRYASGEISREEFEEMKRTLSD